MTISEVDLKFLELSNQARRESHDPHRQVGAVVVSPDGHLLATGSNKPPVSLGYALEDSLEAIAQDPTWKYFHIEHAERNAINDAHNRGVSLEGGTMFCTLFPCADCARAIVAAGIVRLVVPSGYGSSLRDSKWSDHYRYAKEIFDRAGVALDTADFTLTEVEILPNNNRSL